MIVLAVAALVIVAVAVPGLAAFAGSFGRRAARATSDLRMASRGVTPLWNASAIGGEYVSAAAFLGGAGLVLAHGADMLWLPVGAAAAFVLLPALVVAPLRRSGAYTVSDFAEWRLGSGTVRRLATACVCLIGWFYLLPQFRAAGLILRVLTGAPPWAGCALVAGVSLVLVMPGGVRGSTAVQATQFWVKLVALAVPAVALAALWGLDGGTAPADGPPPRFGRATTVRVETAVSVQVPGGTVVTVRGVLDGVPRDGARVPLGPGSHALGAGTAVRFPAGAAVPHVDRLPAQDGATWAGTLGRGFEHGLYVTYSTLLCVVLGTMGLPNILMRFYANGCGRSARRTAALVPVLLALFSVFPALYGALGRLYAPDLLMTGDTDATILVLPQRLAPGAAGATLTVMIAVGAFAACIATSCGIVVAMAGTAAQRVRGRGGRGGIAAFRAGAMLALAVPLAVVAEVGRESTAEMVTMALTVAACTLCPLLVLGVWWRGLTAAGAGAGLATGGGLAVAANMARIVGGPWDGWPAALLAQPAMVLAPVAFAVMAGVSVLTRGHVPRRADLAMARLHVPEDTPAR